MSDLISRQALCEYALNQKNKSVTPNDIMRFPSAQPEVLACGEGELSAQPEPHWIPCSERLPEESGRYLVTRGLKACNSIWDRVYIINYSDLMGLKSEKIWWKGNVGKSDFQKIDDVRAWMPLPEPYAERRTDEAD